MIDSSSLTGSNQATREKETVTADTAEKHMTELSWLIEELQNEIDTFDSGHYSLIHAYLISNLTAEIVKRTLLLRQSVRSMTGYYQNSHY